MLLNTFTSLAIVIAPTLAIPPPSFGFPEAPNDTALTIRFQNSNQDTLVQEAALYGINITANIPQLALNTSAYRSLADYNGTYTIIMVDPDAPFPQNPTNRFVLHWLQPDMSQSPSSDTSSNRTLTPTAPPLVEFRRPSPPTNSSAHRYILYAFQQPSNFSLPPQWSGLSASNRTNFNLTNLINDTHLGVPAAANFFYVSNQTNVPGDLTAGVGEVYPGGDGVVVTSGDPYRPTASAVAGGGSGSSSAGAAMVTGVGSLLGAGVLGLAVLL